MSEAHSQIGGYSPLRHPRGATVVVVTKGERSAMNENSEQTEMVTLRHPHTGDIQVVEAIHEKLVPLMGVGYVQVHSPETSAKGE